MQRRPRRRAPKHLRFIAEQACIICGRRAGAAAHIKFADARVGKPQESGVGCKADDRFTLPLCWEHHAEQHSMAERRFYEKYHIDAIALALALFSISGDWEEADRVIRINMVALRELA